MFDFNGHESWREMVEHELDKPYMAELAAFVDHQRRLGVEIYPKQDQVFSAFRATGLHQIKVVILGQDPYHGANQAHGLSFSVPLGVAIPPSLRNVFKEISTDLNLPNPQHGNLQSWADQGVFLLNSVLTVQAASAASHAGKGWEQFTDETIKLISRECRHVVFMLWGAYAQSKAELVDSNEHLILTSSHPSPLSAHRGFRGCRHFSTANAYLHKHHGSGIDWAVV